jgi:transposase InsO family protein
MKQRNPAWGCPRIAQQIALAFDIPIDKDVVRRILASHYRPAKDSGGPSWLTFLGHMKDSLWSIDLFRCESATLRTHWVLVVMDQYARRIIGFGVHAGTVDGVALCRMFNRAIRWQRWMPKYLSSDHDPLYRFGQWQANLRILDVTEIKTVPYVPLSHPFVERLIGTTWIARCFGRLRISKTSCSISGDTSTIIARTLHWKGKRLTKTRLYHDRSPISIPIDGNLTAEAFITHRWLPDSPKTRAPCGIGRTSANCTSNETSRC